MSLASTHRDLDVYKLSFKHAMLIFNISKSFPKEEKYSLTDQMRRSSRSVSSNIAEAFRKRRYEKMFISKLSDCEGEAAETQVWIEFAYECEYIDKKAFDNLMKEYDNIIGKIINMMNTSSSWGKHFR